MMRGLAWLGLALALSCNRQRSEPDAAPMQGSGSSSAAPSLAPSPSGSEATLARIRGAEVSRRSDRLLDEDFMSREVRVRRAATRAAARIGGARSVTLLTQALVDEDHGVVTWAAYGLGFDCTGHERETVRRLVARSASLPPTADRATAAPPHDADPHAAIAGALARCGTREAEHTLRTWLRASPRAAELGALGLARLASRRHHLDDASLVALLDAADQAGKAPRQALSAFTHLEGLGTSVQARLTAVATAALQNELTRSFAIRALGQGGEAAAEALSKVLGDATLPPADRAEAARQLARLGDVGQAALSGALPALVPAALDTAHLIGPSWAPLAATLQTLERPAAPARGSLEHLAETPLPAGDATALRRRTLWLRCAAAAILAGAATRSQRLMACDPDPKGRQGALAGLRVLDRGSVRGARHRVWLDLVSRDDPVVAQAALALMARHPEIPGPQEVLAGALAREHPGVVAAAAKILAAFPDRAAPGEPEERRTLESGPAALATVLPPAPAIVAAMEAAMGRKRPAHALEPMLSLVEAAGALGLLNLKPRLEAACKSDEPALRARAELSLRRLGDRGRTCPAPPRDQAIAPLPPAAVGGFELTLTTDAGRLQIALDATEAPFAVARVVDLARAGFYAKTVIHRAVPGFVVQLGDPNGDGYGGADAPPLPCESGPDPFGPLSVGMAISGRDTGSSQLFVTLGDYPHLTGDYTRIGTASGAWDQLVEGDVIERVEVRPVSAP